MAPLPDCIDDLSRKAINKILRLPGNSLDVLSAHNFGVFDGPKFVNLSSFLNACAARAAHKTLVDIDEQWLLLRDLSLDSLCLSSLRHGGTSKPEGWDSISFAHHLFNVKNRIPLNSIMQTPKSAGLQARIFRTIDKRDDTNSWIPIINRRLRMFQRERDSDQSASSSSSSSSSSVSVSSSLSSSSSSSSRWVRPSGTVDGTPRTVSQYEVALLATVLKGLSPQVRILHIKTLLNGWTTSYRLNEPHKLKCIFGCQAKDKLRHYLSCHVLWCAIAHTTGQDSLSANVPVRVRLGLSSPSSNNCLSLALAFRVYHSLRNEYLQRILLAKREVRLDDIRSLVGEISRVQWRELR